MANLYGWPSLYDYEVPGIYTFCAEGVPLSRAAQGSCGRGDGVMCCGVSVSLLGKLGKFQGSSRVRLKLAGQVGSGRERVARPDP